MDGSRALKFGCFELQAGHRRLLRNGAPVALGARAFDLLMALAERRERVVTKTELLDLVWPSLVVEENNLQVQISGLRKLLGPQAIATIPGRGYRFVMPLLDENPASDEPEVVVISRPDLGAAARQSKTRRSSSGRFTRRGSASSRSRGS